MCYFTTFNFLCGCSKIKISQPCNDTFTNVQGVLCCRKDPRPHPDDKSLTRKKDDMTFGPGVCSGVQCQWKHALLPLGDFGDSKKRALFEDDTPFDMSEEACKEREDCWYRNLLSTDQQLDFIGVSYPLDPETMSDFARWQLNSDKEDSEWFFWEHFDRAWGSDRSKIRWQELNPRYMDASMLRRVLSHRLLPAEVAIPGNARGSTPLKPNQGPFAVGKHKCKPAKGICKKCGVNVGDPKLRNATLSYQQEQDMNKYWIRVCAGLSYEDIGKVMAFEHDEFEYVGSPETGKYVRKSDEAIAELRAAPPAPAWIEEIRAQAEAEAAAMQTQHATFDGFPASSAGGNTSMPNDELSTSAYSDGNSYTDLQGTQQISEQLTERDFLIERVQELYTTSDEELAVLLRAEIDRIDRENMQAEQVSANQAVVGADNADVFTPTMPSGQPAQVIAANIADDAADAIADSTQQLEHEPQCDLPAADDVEMKDDWDEPIDFDDICA